MLYNRCIRRGAIILGAVGRCFGLSQFPILQELYVQVTRLFLPNSDVWATTDNQKILLPNPRKSILSRMVYLYGEWEGPVTQLLCREIRPGMTAIDVGAHIGYFTLIMAKRVGKEGRIFAFEPNREAQGFLRQNLRQNGHSQATILPMALFREEGYGVMRRRDYLNAELFPQKSISGGAVPMVVYDRIAGSLGIGHVDLIKIDVEGAEMDILFGMRKLLERDHPSLAIEVHTLFLKRFGHSESELREYMESLGYASENILCQPGMTTIYYSWKKPSPIQ
jgi:FkbM family methyltransferase